MATSSSPADSLAPPSGRPAGGRGARPRGGSKATGGLYVAPIALWITGFFVAPMLIIIAYSFMARGLYGGVEPRFSLAAYRALINPIFARVTLTTIWISVASTVLTIALALPAAYYMARSGNAKLLLLVIVPFWTNFLIRIYAWIAILGNNGFLNDLLMTLGVTTDFVQFLYNRNAVITVLVYTYLPYAILPLYSTIDRFDFTLLEAARDLGATHLQSLARVLLPGIKTGIFTAVLFTFIPTFGAYAVPQLIGGQDSYMLGNIIARELTITRNWPLSSAISVVIMLITTAGLMVYLYLNRPRKRA
ncbi:MAG: ABC transporter permease [Spirochaetaceae bacterium]|nr:MAG: ABC transporter permease [Spirochaetaceae bacterium]